MTYQEAVMLIPIDLYRHYKGNLYKVLYIARNSENEEAMVVYQALYGNFDVWVRPTSMWNEEVVWNGDTYQRFRCLDLGDRIRFYEGIYDELLEMSQGAQISNEEIKLKLLDDYYTSGQWQRDYEADEAGMLPDDLKRGVLSEDGVFNLFSEWEN